MAKRSWKKHFKLIGGKPRGPRYFLEQYFQYYGVENPTDEDVCKITEDELQTSYISVKTMKEIMVFQQNCRKD